MVGAYVCLTNRRALSPAEEGNEGDPAMDYIWGEGHQLRDVHTETDDCHCRNALCHLFLGRLSHFGVSM